MPQLDIFLGSANFLVGLLFAIATSICLSIVTICSGLYLRIGICLVLLHKILSHFSW